MSRVATATRLGLREQARRPLLLVLLVGLPFFFITRATAATQPLPRSVGLPGGGEVLTNMRDIHGAMMAAITVAFLVGLVGVFVMQSVRQADRRLVLAGFTPRQALVPRLSVLMAAAGLVLVVSIAVTALSFTPKTWSAFAAGTLLVGMTYGLLGALAGAVVGRLGATHLMLFGAMLDLGIAQNPMFGSGRPPGWAILLPAYGPARVIVDGAFSGSFHAGGELALSIAWVLVLGVTVTVVLGRLIAVKDQRKGHRRDAKRLQPHR